jgi:hypothetical protein
MPYWNNDGLSEAQSFNIPFMKNYFPSYSMPVRNTPITIPAPAQHKLAALIFMNYALSDETQRTMAVQIRQIPANINVLKSNLPPSTFGVNTNLYEFTNKDTFSSYNNPKNIQWITQLMNFYPHGVLRR